MPVVLKLKNTSNEKLPSESVSKFKRRALTTKLKQNSEPNLKQSSQTKPFPSIGQILVNDLITNHELSQDMKQRQEYNYGRKVREEKKEKNRPVKQKMVLNQRDNKFMFGQRKKVLRINQNHSKMSQSRWNTESKQETSTIEKHIQSTKKNMQTLTKLSSRQYFQKNQSSKINSRFVDTGIQTDNCEMSKQSYDEYIKFRITQKQKFQKLKGLFKFIQNFTSVQSQNFKSNVKQFHRMLKVKEDSAQHKKINSFLLKLKQKYLNFDSLFKEVFSKEKENIKEFYQNHTDFLNRTKKILKDLESKLTKLQNDNQRPITTLIQDALNQTFQKYEILSKENNRSFKQKSALFYENYNRLEQKYTEWQRNCIEHSSFIKNCVMNVLKLPQLLTGLYGLENPKEPNKDDQKNSNDEKMIREIMEFLVDRNLPGPNQINDVFLKCCESKCMNCIFMRTKMRLMEDKNNELKPTIELLMNLVSTQTSQVTLN